MQVHARLDRELDDIKSIENVDERKRKLELFQVKLTRFLEQAASDFDECLKIEKHHPNCKQKREIALLYSKTNETLKQLM